MDSLRFLVILLVALPAATAILVAALGAGHRALIRQICLGVTIADAVIALALTIGLVDARSSVEIEKTADGRYLVTDGRERGAAFTSFRPEIVPGAASDTP